MQLATLRKKKKRGHPSRGGSLLPHSVSTLEFEIKRHLDLNISLVWDYLQNPQIESSGALPKHSDLRLNLGVGVKF